MAISKQKLDMCATWAIATHGAHGGTARRPCRRVPSLPAMPYGVIMSTTCELDSVGRALNPGPYMDARQKAFPPVPGPG